MKRDTITIEFKGCFSGCPHVTDAGMGPNYCTRTAPAKLIVGLSSSSSQIPKGKDYPDWCPIEDVKI